MKNGAIYISKCESIFYFAAWTIGVFYSIYRVHLISYHFDDYNDSYQDFAPGWSWIGGKRDTADIEWSTWIPFIYKLFPWTLINIFIGQILKYTKNNTTTLCSSYLTISLCFLWNYVGIFVTICMLIQPCLACLLVSFGSKKIICVVHLVSLGFIQLTKTCHVFTQNLLALEDEKYLMFTISICWMQLRSISCTIDGIDTYKHKNLTGFLKDFLQSAAYCLYLPTLFLGPLILYSDFVDGINQESKKWSLKRLGTFFFNIFRYFFWILFTEFSMHFLHFNALQYHPEVVAKLNPWAFYGFGYCMGQYFLNKYVVVYGIWGEFSRADDIKAPPPPKCIGRIHLYSEMWKHFDRGLYNFLIRYIYVPVSKKKIPLARVLASLLSFAFVFLWHGMQMFIFVWSFLNFVGLTVEGIATFISDSSIFMKFRNNYLTRSNDTRFKCIMAAPLLAFSAISNFYFFAGLEIGHTFVYRIFHDSISETAVLLLLLYCCCQVSTQVKNYEKRRFSDPKKIQQLEIIHWNPNDRR